MGNADLDVLGSYVKHFSEHLFAASINAVFGANVTCFTANFACFSYKEIIPGNPGIFKISRDLKMAVYRAGTRAPGRVTLVVCDVKGPYSNTLLRIPYGTLYLFTQSAVYYQWA